MESAAEFEGPGTITHRFGGIAARDKHTLANPGEVLLEWSFQQLQVTGSA